MSKLTKVQFLTLISWARLEKDTAQFDLHGYNFSRRVADCDGMNRMNAFPSPPVQRPDPECGFERVGIFLTVCLCLCQSIAAQCPRLADLKQSLLADTLVLPVKDTTLLPLDPEFSISDQRIIPGRILSIHQIQKFHVIPVDQYVVLPRPLTDLLLETMAADSMSPPPGELTIVDLHLWRDSAPAFHQGYRLNAYTLWKDSTGTPLRDWIWEIGPVHGQESEADQMATCFEQWRRQQVRALQSVHPQPLYPYIFKRELYGWSDFYLWPGGQAVHAHIRLNFPPVRRRHWVRGSRSLLIRKSDSYQSIAVGGPEEEWYFRLGNHWVARGSASAHLGFNSFDPAVYSHLDYWNLFFADLLVSVDVQYRPVLHRGLTGGAGIFQEVILSPQIGKRFPIGLLLTLGILLP
ncbi:MAG: hypothetical protein D6762_09300 [Candidatus Neomarinimicrobiota bacterium]|nr:MAG: hypothetical protein D6762_09300 [Candidatus Neomarinimicrobiota bacterium]